MGVCAEIYVAQQLDSAMKTAARASMIPVVALELVKQAIGIVVLAKVSVDQEMDTVT
jgi:hypothetical protein